MIGADEFRIRRIMRCYRCHRDVAWVDAWGDCVGCLISDLTMEQKALFYLIRSQPTEIGEFTDDQRQIVGALCDKGLTEEYGSTVREKRR